MEQTVVRAPDLDRVVGYPARSFGNEGTCRVRVWRADRVVMLTELDTNRGASITNAAEDAAMAVERALDLRFYGAGWHLVEHYPRRASRSATFDLVTFGGFDDTGRLERPTWQPLPQSLSWLREAV